MSQVRAVRLRDREVCGSTAVVAVALLLPVVGSLQTAALSDVATVAVLLIVPVAVALTVAVTVNVAAAPALSVTVVLMLPLPLGAPHAFPGGLASVVIAQVHVTGQARPGNVSVTAAAVARSGPLFVTTIE